MVVMLDSPIGQSRRKQIDSKWQQMLLATVGQELADRAAEHFEECNTLLADYRPQGGPQLIAPILDIRPVASQVDFLSGSSWESLTRSWHRTAISGATHFSLVQLPY